MRSCFRQATRRCCPPPLALFAFLTDVYPASIEPLHGDAESLPFSSQPVPNRNNAVLKDHSPSWLGIPAYLGKNRAPSRAAQLQHRTTSLLPAPWSHCHAATKHLWSAWFGFSVQTGMDVFKKRHKSRDLDVLETKILHLPKGWVLGKLHQSLVKPCQAGTPIPSMRRALILCTDKLIGTTGHSLKLCRAGSGWTSGRISPWKRLSGTGMGCAGRYLCHHPCRC